MLGCHIGLMLGCHMFIIIAKYLQVCDDHFARLVDDGEDMQCEEVTLIEVWCFCMFRTNIIEEKMMTNMCFGHLQGSCFFDCFVIHQNFQSVVYSLCRSSSLFF